jgi:hypothetical protein
MEYHDEVFKLIVLKRIGCEQPVPEHLQEEFDRRWAEREEQRKAEKLKNDPLSIKRYDPEIASNFDDPYACMDQSEIGDYVKYEDYVKVVEHLKQKISQAY